MIIFLVKNFNLLIIFFKDLVRTLQHLQDCLEEVNKHQLFLVTQVLVQVILLSMISFVHVYLIYMICIYTAKEKCMNYWMSFTFAVTGFVQTAPNGTTVKFNPPTSQDTMVKNGVSTNINTRHQCITAMKEYQSKSLEELRVEDYLSNRKGKQATTGFATPSASGSKSPLVTLCW